MRRALRPALCAGVGVLATAAVGLDAVVVAAQFPAELELSSLLPSGGGDGSAGFVLNGIDAGGFGAESGRSVSDAGDVNGDGIGDLIIGARFANTGGHDAGESYVVFGRDTAQAGNFPAVLPLATLLPGAGGDGSVGFVLRGIDAGDDCGNSVSAAGDVNGDGIGDLIVGATDAAPGGRAEAGESYVVFGRDTAQVGNFPAVLPLASLLPAGGGYGSAGFVLNGIDPDDHSGFSVSAAGDVNGDDIGDLIVGASGADPGRRDDAGESYVVFGRNTAQAGNFPAVLSLASLLPGGGGDGSAGFVLTGVNALDHSGMSVSAAGDVTGDGIGDLIVGARNAAPGGRGSAGESYVVFGRDTVQVGNFPAVLALANLLPGAGGDGSAGFVLSGIDAGDLSGDSVSAAGDVNGDGIGDLIVGASSANPAGRDVAGESYVVFGRDIAQAGNFPAVLPLARLLPPGGGDGSDGFVLHGVGAFDESGRSVSAAGDVNGDGIGDLIIGASEGDPGGRDNAGQSYVVFGRDTAQAGNFPAVIELSSLLTAGGGDGSAGFVLNGVGTSDYAGFSVSAAGDVNGDGNGDVIVGAFRARAENGQSYVVFGRSAVSR